MICQKCDKKKNEHIYYEVNISGRQLILFATWFSFLILCFKSPDTHRSLLISSELKSFSVSKLRPFRFTEPKHAAPTLEVNKQSRQVIPCYIIDCLSFP